MDFSEKKLYDESETYSEYSDDSQDDPSFDVLEETRLTFSNLSVKKKTKTRVKGTKEEEENERSDVIEMVIPELDDDDRKNYETIQKIIEGGQVEKLKVDQCKIYLRKHGLRLSGNKETLILRIKEHIEIVNGGGEKKYLPSSFVLNCKGDACMGDVVMFEQNVYEVFNIASRSANGPPCGTRVVAGRIVKESYGAAKQQHTFTIEVLWSKGEKPLAPLHPLLIKGRNLYRLKTMRQKWEDEGERRKMLSEKHARGGAARLNREARIQQKEMRKTQKSTRATRDEHSHGNQKAAKIEPLHSVTLNPNKLTNQPKQHTLNNTTKPQILTANPNIITHTHILPATIPQRQPLNCSFGGGQPTILQPVNFSSSAGLTWSYSHDGRNYTNYSTARIPVVRLHHHPSYFHPNVSHANRTTQGHPFKENRGCGPVGGPIRGVGHERKQACRYYYAQGRCRFGDGCRYLHELASNK